MKKYLLVLQGAYSEDGINCAKSFRRLDIDILFVIWKNNSIEIKEDNIIIKKINDPKSIKTKDQKNFINTNRQITAMKYVLDKYSDKYEFIIKIRNDIFLENPSKFKNNLVKAFKIKKIWTIGNQTGSPRYFLPILFNIHVSDWFFAGSPKLLKKKLQLELIDENLITLDESKVFKNLIFWRKASNEQVIWRIAWRRINSKNKFKLKINHIGEKPTFKKCFANAKYLSDNFYISNLREIGLQSIKYPSSPLTFYRNRYHIFQLGRLESFFINRGLYFLSVFYFPLIRLIIFYIFYIFKKERIRF